MEKPLLKKKFRKIRCTQEFNQLNRTSLVTPSSKSEPEKNSTTKKNKNLSYLPQIYFDDEPVKENCSPNINDITKKSIKKTRVFDKQSLESTEMKVRCTSGTSTEDDKRDSEIEIKKKKKKRKQKKQTEPKHVSSSDVISGNETQIIDTYKISVVKKTPAKPSLKHTMTPQANEKLFVNEGGGDNNKKTRNSILKINKPANGCISKSMTVAHTARNSRNSISKALKSFSVPTTDPTSECESPKSISMKHNTRKSKNSACKARQSNIHTSESLAPTPISSDDISDNVFGENVNNDTLELFSDTKYNDSQDNSDEKRFMFDISGLSVTKESHPFNPDGKRSVRFTTQPAERRSKSLDNSHNISNRKSSFTTPMKNTSLKVKSLNLSNKGSVSFASVDSRRSKSLHEDNSKIFPKSPYITRASKTSSLISKDATSNCNISESESSDESDYFQDESSPQKRKSTMNLDKKSVSFSTPINNNKNKSKISFKKSPFVPRSTLDQSSNSSVDSCSNSPNNETFDLSSPTIELETLKNKSVLTSPTTSSLSEKNNGNFSSTKSIINLVTPSPQSPPNETKIMNSFSFSLQNLLSATDDMNKTSSFGDNKSNSEMKVTKRKRWNKSLGASIMDSEGILHNILSPWGKETNDFRCINEHNYSRNSFLSPIKKIDSVKKSLSRGCNSTNKAISTKNIHEELDKSLGIIHAETLGVTFRPIKNESPKKPFEIQPKPSTSKLENKGAVKRTKLPNFALIHQRAFDKLEDVREMSQRKAARAHQLLSGKKPGPDTNMRLPPSNLKIKTPTLKIKSPKSRKLLRYSPKKRQSPEKIQIIKSPTSNIIVIKTQTKITPSTSNFKKISKPVQKKLMKSHIPKPLNVDKKPLSKLGFKVGPAGTNKATRQEDLKAAVNKTQPKKNTLEARRNVLQNVRTNRRFDLLMKMRNKKD